MRLLLDTSPFLWFVTGSAVLPERVTDAIRAADHEVWLSVVSFREILLKHRLGRLTLPEPAATYIPRQRDPHLIATLALEEAAIAHLTKLPAIHHDPFDRMLVCQAIEHDLTIITPDRMIQSYPVKTFWPS